MALHFNAGMGMYQQLTYMLLIDTIFHNYI